MQLSFGNQLLEGKSPKILSLSSAHLSASVFYGVINGRHEVRVELRGMGGWGVFNIVMGGWG